MFTHQARIARRGRLSDAANGAVAFVADRSDLSREEAYMLLSIIGELRIGTSPRPVMAARLIIPKATLREAGWREPVS